MVPRVLAQSFGTLRIFIMSAPWSSEYHVCGLSQYIFEWIYANGTIYDAYICPM